MKPGRYDHAVQDSRRRIVKSLVGYALLFSASVLLLLFGLTVVEERGWTPGGYVAQLAVNGCLIQDWEGVEVWQSPEHIGVRVRPGPGDAVIHVPGPYVYIQNPTPADIERARAPGACGAATASPPRG